MSYSSGTGRASLAEIRKGIEPLDQENWVGPQEGWRAQSDEGKQQEMRLGNEVDLASRF